MPPKRKQSNPPAGRQPSRKRQNSSQAESDDGSQSAKPATRKTQPKKAKAPPTPGIRRGLRSKKDDEHSPLQVFQPTPRKPRARKARGSTSEANQSESDAPQAEQETTTLTKTQVQKEEIEVVNLDSEPEDTESRQTTVVEKKRTVQKTTNLSVIPEEEEEVFPGSPLNHPVSGAADEGAAIPSVGTVQTSNSPVSGATVVREPVVGSIQTSNDFVSGAVEEGSSPSVVTVRTFNSPVSGGAAVDVSVVGSVQTSNYLLSGDIVGTVDTSNDFISRGVVGTVDASNVFNSREIVGTVDASNVFNSGEAVGTVETPHYYLPGPDDIVESVEKPDFFMSGDIRMSDTASLETAEDAVTPVPHSSRSNTPDESPSVNRLSRLRESSFHSVEVDPSYVPESPFKSMAHLLNYRRWMMAQRENQTSEPPEDVDGLAEKLGPDASEEELRSRIEALEKALVETRSDLKKTRSELSKEQMLTSSLTAERQQHIYRNKQWEVVGRVNGMSPEKVYALRPEELEALEGKVRTVEEEEDAADEMEDSKEQETHPVQADSAAYELLRKVERASKASRRKQRDVTMTDATSHDEAESAAPQSPANEGTATTPKSSGWAIPGTVSRLLQRFVPSFLSPLPAPPALNHPPATAPPAMLPADEAHKLREELAPTTPTRPSRHRRTQNGPEKLSSTGQRLPRRKQAGSSRVIVKRYLKKVDDDLKPQAKEWFKEQLKQIEEDTRADQSGSKRKRPTTPLKIGDLKEIPARAPWQSTGSFGLQDDFFDESDEEEAPAWIQIQEFVKSTREESNPKRQKIDTRGASPSVVDVTPRPATSPSPMFGNAEQSYHGGNMFNSAEKEEAAKKLKREGHVAGTGTFCVPEDSDEDSTMLDTSETSATEESTEQQSAPLWTQQPPPAPTPAHASLPGPVTAPPSIPAVQQEDPAEIQRKRAMKYTPARPSRLRHGEIPSPIVDVAGAGRCQGSGLGVNGQFQPLVKEKVVDFDFSGFPDFPRPFEVEDGDFGEVFRFVSGGGGGHGGFGGGEVVFVESSDWDSSDDVVGEAERLLSVEELEGEEL